MTFLWHQMYCYQDRTKMRTIRFFSKNFWNTAKLMFLVKKFCLLGKELHEQTASKERKQVRYGVLLSVCHNLIATSSVWPIQPELRQIPQSTGICTSSRVSSQPGLGYKERKKIRKDLELWLNLSFKGQRRKITVCFQWLLNIFLCPGKFQINLWPFQILTWLVLLP